MLIKKLYNVRNMTKRIDMYSGGNLNTAFHVAPDLFIICNCGFWKTIKKKIMVITVEIEEKETLNGYTIERDLEESERDNLKYVIKNYFEFLPETKLIQIYE